MSKLDVIAHDLNGFGGQSFIKLNGVGATEVVLTFRLPIRALEYIEHDWMDAEVPAATALGLPAIPDCTFGQSRMVDVQTAFGDQGFHSARRQLQLIPEGMLTFVSFEIEERPNAIYTFVFEYSRDLAERGLLDYDQLDLTKAILVATIVARPDYAGDFCCSEEVPYTAEPEGMTDTANDAFDFLPTATTVVPTDPWELITELFLMIAKNGAVTWGDRLHLVLDITNCT